MKIVDVMDKNGKHLKYYNRNLVKHGSNFDLSCF